MASSYSAKECHVCQEEYNAEEKCPRGLPCSHTICSECLHNLIIRNLKTCPFCLRKFTANSVRDIGINTGLLDLLELLREMEMRVSAQPESKKVTESIRMIDQKRENDEVLNLLESLKQADDEIDRQLLRNTQSRSCLSKAEETILKEIQPRINEGLSENSSTTSCLEKHKLMIKEIINLVTGAKTELKSAQECSQIGKTAAVVEEIKYDAESYLQELMEQLAKYNKAHPKLEVTNATKDLARVKRAVYAIKTECLLVEPEQMVNSKLQKFLSIPQPVTIASLQSRSGSVMELIGKKLVYAVKEIDGQRRYAEISLQEKNRICLHCLKKQNIPSNAYILQHSDVLNLMDVSSRLVFLQLSLAEEKTLGKLFIRLSPDSKRAQQFSLLCSGENTASYINSNMLNVFWKDTNSECASIGDCDRMRGKGGRGLVPDFFEEKEEGVFIQMAGTVQGRGRAASADKRASQFFVTDFSVVFFK